MFHSKIPFFQSAQSRRKYRCLIFFYFTEQRTRVQFERGKEKLLNRFPVELTDTKREKKHKNTKENKHRITLKMSAYLFYILFESTI